MTTQQHIQDQALEKLIWNWRGHPIQYTVMGQGKPLLLIHGFGASIGHWRNNIPPIADAGYRVFALDLLGFGGSNKPVLNYTVELWQQQLRDFWKEHINEPTVFVGNSIGGLLAMIMMSEYPEMTAGGVLINCAGGLNHRPEEFNLPLRLMMGMFTKIVGSPLTGKVLFNAIRQKDRIRSTLHQVYCDRNAITDELVDMLYQPSCDPNAQQVFASILTAPAGPKPSELLPRIQHPLLILWGEADPWTPIQGASLYQERAKNGQDTEFHGIPSAGHCPHDENPTVVNKFILDWLQRNSVNIRSLDTLTVAKFK